MEIRGETPGDIKAIRTITRAAFAPVAHGGQTEAAIVDALRASGALIISLVAVENDEVAGHVAFSPVTIDDADRGWFGLGPVCVRPDKQGKGMGVALIQSGLDRLSALKAKGCVVLGEPDYYRRFGFEADPGLVLEGVPAEYFMRRVLVGGAPTGRVAYHKAFEAK